MTIVKRETTVLLLVVILAVTCLSACSASYDNSNEPVAIVNGEEAPQWEYDFNVKQNLAYLQNYGIDPADPSVADIVEKFKSDAYNRSIYNALSRSLVEKLQIEVSDEKVEQTLNEKILPNYEGEKELKAELINLGINEEQFKQIIRTQLIQQEIYNLVTKGIGISEAEAKTVYNQNPNDYDLRKVSHIIIIPEDMSDDKLVAEAKAKVAGLIDQLNAGADFAKLAKEYSQDGSAAAGGVMDYEFSAKTSPYVPEFTQACLELTEVGRYSKQPVVSSMGVHIIKLDSYKKGFENFKEEIINEQSGTAKNQVYNDYMDEALSAADVEKLLTFDLTTENEAENGTEAGEEAGEEAAE